MQLFRIARDGKRLGSDFGNRRRVERADAAGVGPDGAAHLHCARPPLFQRRIVEIGVRIRIENLVRERRRLGCVDRHGFQRPGADVLDELLQAVEIHRLVQAVLDRLVDERMVGNADVADDVFLAGGLVRKDRGEQIVGAHALDLRRHLPPAGEPQDGERARRVPSPSHFEHRRRQHRLREHLFDGFLAQELEHELEWKAVLIAERDDDAVVGGGGLQLEVERAAEALAQRESPRSVDARAERRVQHELHAAPFVEEPFGDDGGDAGQRTERRRACAHVQNGLLCAAGVEMAIADEEIDGRRNGVGRGFRGELRKPLPTPFRGSSRATLKPQSTAPMSGPALHRARTESSARRLSHLPRARGPLRRGGCATTSSRA